MPTSVELRQQRARVVEQVRALVDGAEGRDDPTLSADEQRQWDSWTAEFRTLGERIERQEWAEEQQRQSAQPLNRSGQGGDPGATQTADERRAAARSAFRVFLQRGVGGVAPEQRALIEDTAGEILVPEDLEAEIMRELPEITIMRSLCGARTIGTNRVRRRSFDEVAVGWGSLERSEQTLTDSMPDTPTEEYTYVEDMYGLAKMGEDEMDDSDVNLEAYVRDSFTRAVGEAEDTAFVIGTGHTNHQPIGFTTAGGGVPSVVGQSIDYAQVGDDDWMILDDLLKLIYACPAQYRGQGAFVMSSTVEMFIATKRNTNGERLWQPSTQAGRPNTFQGYSLRNQEDMATLAVNKVVAAFGNFQVGYRIYDRMGMTVQRLVELYSEDGLIGFKIRRRLGGDVIRPQAIRLLKTAAS